MATAKTAISTNEQLTGIAQIIGAKNGYDDIQAEFSPFRDFKVKWTRSFRWISFEVSDYLMDAPEAVIKDLFENIFRKIRGEDVSLYTPRVTRYLSSKTYLKTHQKTYIGRYRGIREQAPELKASVKRLEDAGLVQHDPSLYIAFDEGNRGAGAKTSVIMHVVSVQERCADLPENALDFLIYTQLASIRLGVGAPANSSGRRAEYAEALDAYPGRAEAERELRAAGISY